LYDVLRDPTQLDNVAEQHADVVERLASRVLAWQKTLPPGPVEPSAGKSDYAWPGQVNQKPASKKAPSKPR
jgi:hypothetical protein